MDRLLAGFSSAIGRLGMGPSTPSTQSSFSRPASSAAVSVAGSYSRAPGYSGAVTWGAPPPLSVYSATGSVPVWAGSTTSMLVGEAITPESVAEFFSEGYPNVTFDVAAEYYQRKGGFDLRDYWQQNKDNWLCHLEPEDSYQVKKVANLIRLEEVAQLYPDVKLTPTLALRLKIIFSQILDDCDGTLTFVDWTYQNLHDYAEHENLWSYTICELTRNR